MAPTLLVARANPVVLSSATADLLIAVLAIVLAGLLMTGTALLVRRYRRSKSAAGLPIHHGPQNSHHRRVAISSASKSRSIFVYNEKQELLASTSSPPCTPLPEIRITFPEEVDDSGKPQTGRVVVVHVGDKGEVGLAPVDEKLPAYQQSAADRFHSLDLDRIGGLKEKEISL